MGHTRDRARRHHRPGAASLSSAPSQAQPQRDALGTRSEPLDLDPVPGSWTHGVIRARRDLDDFALPSDPAQSSLRPRRIGWANLLARVFALDITRCRRCGGRIRAVAVVSDPTPWPASCTALALRLRLLLPARSLVLELRPVQWWCPFIIVHATALRSRGHPCDDDAPCVRPSSSL